MYKRLTLVPLIAAGLFFSATTFSQAYQFVTVYSPGCGPIKLQDIGETGILSIAARLTKAGRISGYVVTLDPYQLTYHQLIEKMSRNHCMNKKSTTRFNRYEHKAPEKLRR